jgi:hypothetical protein
MYLSIGTGLLCHYFSLFASHTDIIVYLLEQLRARAIALTMLLSP